MEFIKNEKGGFILPKKEIELFRIEKKDTGTGMWYEPNGVYNPFIFQLTEGISKDLPMEEDARYRKDGKEWFSGCGDIEQLKMWFSNLDVEELLESNFQFYRHQLSDYIIEEHQVLYTKESISHTSILDPKILLDR